MRNPVEMTRHQLTDWLAAAETRGGAWWVAAMLLGLNRLRCGELLACNVEDVGNRSWHHTLLPAPRRRTARSRLYYLDAAGRSRPCPARRLRHLEDLQQARAALRVWLCRPGTQPADLLALAAHFPNALGQLRADLEVLL